MLRKESKFYVINFIDPGLLKKKNVKTRAMKTHTVFRNCIKKVSGKMDMCARVVNGSEQLYY